MNKIREKLVELLQHDNCPLFLVFGDNVDVLADYLIANGVTMQECCHKAKSVISKTGLMCTACHSDIDRDAVFCKYCGAKVMPILPKGGVANVQSMAQE